MKVWGLDLSQVANMGISRSSLLKRSALSCPFFANDGLLFSLREEEEETSSLNNILRVYCTSTRTFTKRLLLLQIEHLSAHLTR
jgi:hypothetical protein